MGKCLNGVKLGEMSLSCAMETTTCVIKKVKVVQVNGDNHIKKALQKFFNTWKTEQKNDDR